MFVVHAGFQGGFYIALVSASLSEEHVEAALHEPGIEAQAVLELGGWQTSGSGVAVAHVPFPAVN
jgi:hypothetical protein